MSRPVPMSADVMVAHLRPLAAKGNLLAVTYVDAIETAPDREAAARAVAVTVGVLFDSLRETVEALAPVIAAWNDIMGPN